jgi:hypothetical protein
MRETIAFLSAEFPISLDRRNALFYAAPMGARLNPRLSLLSGCFFLSTLSLGQNEGAHPRQVKTRCELALQTLRYMEDFQSKRSRGGVRKTEIQELLSEINPSGSFRPRNHPGLLADWKFLADDSSLLPKLIEHLKALEHDLESLGTERSALESSETWVIDDRSGIRSALAVLANMGRVDGYFSAIEPDYGNSFYRFYNLVDEDYARQQIFRQLERTGGPADLAPFQTEVTAVVAANIPRPVVNSFRDAYWVFFTMTEEVGADELTPRPEASVQKNKWSLFYFFKRKRTPEIPAPTPTLERRSLKWDFWYRHHPMDEKPELIVNLRVFR